MTSVLGHLISRDFEPKYSDWKSCDPSALFDARINSFVQDKMKPIEKNIEQQARYANYLYIWTDCDREGENIGTEIRGVAAKANSRLLEPGKTVRARFSNIEKAHIVSAARNPGRLDEAQSQAVASRMELDLRTGACFTRNLTLTLQHLLEERQTISYGSCQFPTLGFVVDRYFRVRNFVPEKFWSIQVRHEKDGVQVSFRWARNHLFDRLAVVVLFERCLNARRAQVTKVQNKSTSKWKPLPLTTVELQKCGSRFLRLDSQKTLQVAESLYQKGWISYPRTETDQFDRGMNLEDLVQKQTQGGPWANYAQQLSTTGFTWPRNGRNNDKAHPPIHPVNFVNPSILTDDEKKVHEFVVRRFLACCSEDAKGAKTEVGITYGDETFNATGLTVLERNYLDVYPYDKWTSSQPLPRFAEGETFEPSEAHVQEGETSPPGYLTEPELISLMDANGIGTDATMAEHIARIKDRKYAQTRTRGTQGPALNDDDPQTNEHVSNRGRGGGRGRGGSRGGRGGRTPDSASTGGVQEFIPTTLGVALVEGFDGMGFDVSLTKPFLRKEVSLTFSSQEGERIC